MHALIKKKQKILRLYSIDITYTHKFETWQKHISYLYTQSHKHTILYICMQINIYKHMDFLKTSKELLFRQGFQAILAQRYNICPQ